MMVLVIRHVALEGYKYIRRSGNIVCVFMCKVDIDSWPSYYFNYFNGSYYIYNGSYYIQNYLYIYIYSEFIYFIYIYIFRILVNRCKILTYMFSCTKKRYLCESKSCQVSQSNVDRGVTTSWYLVSST